MKFTPTALVFVPFFFLLTLLFSLHSSYADDYHAQMAKFDILSTQEVIEKAEAGDMIAQHYLAGLYTKGKRVRGSHEKAAMWLKRSAEQGYVESEFFYGYIHIIGKGAPVNYKIAAEWFKKAAEHGHAVAQHNLALLYDKGQGVPQDSEESLKWAQLSAGQGNSNAQDLLGAKYAMGKGVRQDYAKAAEYFTLAAEQGVPFSQYKLGRIYAQGLGVKQDLDKAAYWWKKAAAQGHKEAKQELQHLTKYQKKARQQSDVKEIRFGDIASLADGYRKGDPETIKKFEALMDTIPEDVRRSIYTSIGEQYYTGDGVVLRQDYEAAYYWHTKGADQGHPVSKQRLGEMLASGKGTSKDPEKAQALAEEIKNMGATSIGAGAGFFVNNTYIITNKHVVYDCSSISVRFPNTKNWVPAHLKAMPRKEDLAVLESSQASSQYAVLAAKDPLVRGETIRASTFKNLNKGLRESEPVSHELRVIEPETPNKVKRTGSDRLMVRDRINMTHNGKLGKGDSGSPLLNKDNYVVGIVSGQRGGGLITFVDSNYAVDTPVAGVPLKALTSFLKKEKIEFYTEPDYVPSNDPITVQVKCEKPFS